MVNSIQLADDGKTLTVLNDSGTTAITAGDLLYFATNDDMFGTTVADGKDEYGEDDVKVKAADWSNAAHLTPAGVAITDIASDGYGTMAMEGLFLSRVGANTEAGECLMFESTTSQKLVAIKDLGTTVLVQGAGLADLDVGRALTGGSADKKVILWRLNI